MKTEIVVRLHRSFEEHAHSENGVEFWLARELQELLGYAEWRNFNLVVDRAKTACANAGAAVADHFVDVNKMVDFGHGPATAALFLGYGKRGTRDRLRVPVCRAVVERS